MEALKTTAHLLVRGSVLDVDARGNRRGTQLGDMIRGRQNADGGQSKDYTVATTGDKRIQESE